MTRLCLIAAVARNGVIGNEQTMPWHLPEDLKHFRRVTMGAPAIMGRRTWQSLPARFRPLPGRRNIVVTRNTNWRDEGAERASSLDAALMLVADAPRAFVTGGGALYAEALPRADELLLTEIDHDFAGDVRFPDWPREDFVETAREVHHAVEPGGFDYAFVTYRRRTSALT